MAAPLTRRGVLGRFAAAGTMLALGLPSSTKASIPRHMGRVLIVDEGAFASYPTPLYADLQTQGFGVHTLDFTVEGIDLGSVHEFDAVILGPRLSRQDRAWLQLAFRMAKIKTPVLTL